MGTNTQARASSTYVACRTEGEYAGLQGQPPRGPPQAAAGHGDQQSAGLPAPTQPPCCRPGPRPPSGGPVHPAQRSAGHSAGAAPTRGCRSWALTFHSKPATAKPPAAPEPASPMKRPEPSLLAKREAPIWKRGGETGREQVPGRGHILGPPTTPASSAVTLMHHGQVHRAGTGAGSAGSGVPGAYPSSPAPAMGGSHCLRPAPLSPPGQ